MAFVWIRETASDLEGLVADLCPACQAPCAFFITHRYMTHSIQGIRLGSGELVDATRQCVVCRGWWKADASRYAAYHSAYARQPPLDALMAETNPALAHCLRKIDALAHGGSGYRATGRDDESATSIKAALLWIEALGGDVGAELERLEGYWQLPAEARQDRLEALNQAAIDLNENTARNPPGPPAGLKTPFRRGLPGSVAAAILGATLASIGGLLAVYELAHVSRLPLLASVAAVGASFAGAAAWRHTLGTWENVVFAMGVGAAGGAFVVLAAFDAVYHCVWVDNASADAVVVFVDGSRRDEVESDAHEQLYVKRGPHRLGSALVGETTPSSELEVVLDRDILYNPGKTASYRIHTDLYSSRPRTRFEPGDEDGPLTPAEIYAPPVRIHNWLRDNPDEVETRGTTERRVAFIRDELGMRFVQCPVAVRDRLSRCVREAMRADDTLIDVCVEAAGLECAPPADD